MSNIDKQDSQVQRYANFGVDMMEWDDGGYVKHSDYLALLDELEAAEKRIAELTEKPIGWTDEQELRDVEKLGCGYLFNANPITPHADPRRVILLYAAAAGKGE